MKNYEKPVVMVNEGLAEGVYAASGCWEFKMTQTTHYDENVPNEVEYNVVGVHTNPDGHNASYVVTITFNQNVSVLNCGLGTPIVNGSVVTVAYNVGTNNPTCDAGGTLKIKCENRDTLTYSYTWECTQ